MRAAKVDGRAGVWDSRLLPDSIRTVAGCRSSSTAPGRLAPVGADLVVTVASPWSFGHVRGLPPGPTVWTMSASVMKKALTRGGRGLVFDVLVVVMWRFLWHRSWAASLAVGGVMLALNAGFVLYGAWLDRHPEAVERARARRAARVARQAERLARRTPH